jgi:kumamolisin
LVDPSTLDPYFKRMAAQGQTFFAASGDASTWTTANAQTQPWPADDPYVVSVGGTDLITVGAAGPWASETAWGGSGGGISPNNIAIPSWQQIAGVITSTNLGSTVYRNGPDVAANANYTFYVCSNQSGCSANNWGGTSFAAPMWAGYIALVNQQLAANKQSPIGFLNPIIYPQNVTSAYATNFHDVTSGASGSYSAVPGFDLVTGWGSPTPALVAALVASSSSSPQSPPAQQQPTNPSFTLSAAPASVSVRQGKGAASFTIATAAAGGFNSTITLSATGAPSGSTVTFTPRTISGGTGSSSLSIKVPRNTSLGSRTLTITATGGGLIQTATVTLTVTN